MSGKNGYVLKNSAGHYLGYLTWEAVALGEAYVHKHLPVDESWNDRPTHYAKVKDGQVGTWDHYDSRFN